MDADIAIHDAYVLTVDDRNRLYERGTVLMGDGRITEVRASRDDDADIDATRVIDGEGTLVMPGLVNAHTHLELTPLMYSPGRAVIDDDLRHTSWPHWFSRREVR